MESVELAWEREAVGCSLYLLRSSDPQVQAAMKLQTELAAMGLYSYTKVAQEVLQKYSMQVPLSAPLSAVVSGTKTVVAELKQAQMDALRTRLRSKVIHGVFNKQPDGSDTKSTYSWLKDVRLRPKTGHHHRNPRWCYTHGSLQEESPQEGY